MRRLSAVSLALGLLALGACAASRRPPCQEQKLDNSRFLHANRAGGFPISVPTLRSR
jgi:hypothetical protein